MNKEINCILLVDDDKHDNFFHQRVIKKNGHVKTVNEAMDGLEALDYIQNKGKFSDKELNPRPNIIFLDINMPKMNGFEFLEEYNKLPKEKKAEVCIIMLTTSRDSNDIKHANSHLELSRFASKPLTPKMLDEVMNDYFAIIESN